MSVVCMNKTSFTVAHYLNVTNIAYNATTKIYTISFGNNQTATLSADNYTISILF